MNELIYNVEKLHTTPLGVERINKNLNLNNIDVIEYCKNIVIDNNSKIYKKGKNWYCENNNIIITINSYNYGVITAHLNTSR